MTRLLRTLAASLLLVTALSAAADPVADRAVDRVILPAMAGFTHAAATLRNAAAADCRATNRALRGAYNTAFDAWLRAAPYRFGPLETEALAIAYWPDPKGNTGKALARLIAADDPALADPVAYARVSVAARGLFALETMLYDPEFNGYGPADPGCALVRTATADLAATAARVNDTWQASFAAQMKTAGAPGNPRFLGAGEVRQALLTALLAELEFTADLRLGRPLGTLDRPRPARAEAHASGRSLRNVTVSLSECEVLMRALSSGRSGLLFSYMAYAQRVAATLDDPVFAGVDRPGTRLKIQDLQDAVRRVRDTAIAELGPELGVAAGFNAMDGD